MISARGESINETGIADYSEKFYKIVVAYHRQNPDKFFSFSHGNPHFECPIDLKQIGDKYSQNSSFIRQYFPLPHVLPDIKLSIIDYFKRQQFNMNDMDVTLGNGVISLIHASLTIACNPYDKVLINNPYYGLFEWIAKTTSNCLVTLETNAATNFKITPEALDQTLTDDPDIKAFLLVNPHNPTGHVYSFDELKALGKVLLKHTHVTIIANEIYYQIIYAAQFVSFAYAVPELRDRIITLRGFSKDFGLAKERIGIVHAHSRLIEKINLFYMAISHGVSYHGQLIVKEILNNDFQSYLEKMNTYYQGNLAIINQTINRLNILMNQIQNTFNVNYIHIITEPQSGFFVCLDFKKLCQYKKINTDFELIAALLNYSGISLAPGALFGWHTESCILRLTYSQSIETLCYFEKSLVDFIVNNQ